MFMFVGFDIGQNVSKKKGGKSAKGAKEIVGDYKSEGPYGACS